MRVLNQEQRAQRFFFLFFDDGRFFFLNASVKEECNEKGEGACHQLAENDGENEIGVKGHREGQMSCKGEGGGNEKGGVVNGALSVHLANHFEGGHRGSKRGDKAEGRGFVDSELLACKAERTG